MALETDYYRSLQQRVKNHDVRIGVFGLTSESLKDAVSYAREGFSVICMDFRELRVEMVNRGISFTPEVSDLELLRLIKTGKIEATTDTGLIGKMDFLKIYPSRPFSSGNRYPDIHQIMEAVAHTIKPGIILGLNDENETLVMHAEMERIMRRAGLSYGLDYLFGSFRKAQA
ncbi:MAG: hypothetical protein K2F63_05170 [Muribaculaceae bacterium]|nr:hypothetical protein [Muribaculaceae bacterium]MDE6134476.1 hypothetical protein [Muribaculaceae bacterium]